MTAKNRILILFFLILPLVSLQSLLWEEVERILETDNSYDLLVQANNLASEGKIEEAIELQFEVWKMNRSSTAHLLVIAFMYSDLNNPEMSGKFLLEFAKRDISGGHFQQEGLESNFANVWNDVIFIPYRDEAIEIVNTRVNENK